MAGERRGASARRGGMIVLGKVAVPKPLNLPSQRLENHGMDPTVEIVPKGTLSWGSRTSSSTSNAWGSFTFSPKADGGTSSPSHLCGRPSSGSGTRPSSSCSDRTHEPNSNACGQSSRPSSASGALTSNQTALASLHPQSVETRPGSSHLSRFAETSSDISGAWGPTGISKKLGVPSSKNDGFSLSSGDFPTLGSEKENSERSADSKDHGPYSRPGSSSRVSSGKEQTATSSVGDNSVNASVNVNTWRRDGPQHVEDGMFRPPAEQLQGDPPPYLNVNIPPQHFDVWHGPPRNPPPGVWYRGPLGGPPYATPLGPGGFPMDPFPYYRPQIPPSALANPQPVLPPGAGPRGHHSKNGDMYRPHIPDGYVHSGMPIRPVFYPGPVPYEDYYGPPMGYCNSSERDSPFMGMPAGPPIYSRYPGKNAPYEPGNNHARAGTHGPTGRVPVSEQMESGLPENACGPYKVLLKQHNEWDEKRTEDKWEHPLPDNAPYPGKGDPPRKSSHKNEWGSEDKKDDEIYSGRRILGGDKISSQNFDNQGRYVSDLPENRGKAKTVDRSSVRKMENAASTFSQAPKVFPATPKDSTLIRKIEGLNAKARSSDGRPDAASAPNGEDQRSRLEVVDAKVNHLRNEAGTIFGRINTTATLVPASREVGILTADSSLFSTVSSGTTVSSRASHGLQGRLDHHGKRFNTQDADGRRNKPLGAESTVVVSALTSEPSSNVSPQGPLPSLIAAEKYVINLQEKDEEETPIFDPSDCQEQRAKMSEIAKQRALQLQKEEDERIREQKAKALAKLEELNRRIQAVDGSTQKMEKAPPSVSMQQEKQDCQVPVEQVMVGSKSETPTPELDSNPNAQITKRSAIGDTELTDLSNATPIEMSENVQLKQVVPHPVSDAEPKAATQVNEGSILRNKHTGNKQRHNSSLRGNLMEKSVSTSSTEAQKNNADVAVNDVASTEAFSGEVGPTRELGLPINTNILTESSAHQRRKNNRSSKNKHKSYEVPSVAALVPKETNAEKASLESGKLQSSELELDPSSFQPSEQQWTSLPTEEPSGMDNSRWRSQRTRRMPKNQQANRNAEKEAVIWAPVRSDKKADFIDNAGNRTLPETVISTAKGNNVIRNYPKSKRAEMERYVPKPVAKEQLSQQTLLDETVESSQTVNLTIGYIVCTVESANGNGKQNKQSKVHGSWRQRGLQDGSSSVSDPSKNIQESIEQQEPSLKPEVNSMKDKTKLSDDWNDSGGWNTFSDEWNTFSDGWNTYENSDTAPVSSAVVKDQGVITGRGKRHPFKGHRNVSSGDTDKSSSQTRAPEIVGQADKSSTSKDNRTTSHWQPKSQVSAFPSQRGNRPAGGQTATAAEIRNPIKKDSHSQDRVQMAPHHKKDRGEHTVDPSIDQSVLEEKNEVVVPNVGHQESMREKKVDSFRGHPIPPNQSSVVYASDFVPPPSRDAKNEQQYFSSGFRRNGNQNNRSGRVHESRGDWSLGGQDNRQHNNTSSIRERQSHDSHYEYQPIGQQNYSKSNNFEGPTGGSHNPGSRYRERSQGYSRHGGGNFNNRQGGTVRVEASYD